MIIFAKKIQKILNSLFEIVVPSCVRRRIDAVTFGIAQFICFASKEINPSEKILDAGAGSCPYKKYFSHAKYESTDFEDVFDKSSKGDHDFVCNLEKIPRPKNSYDAVLCTEVLEHVENPQKVINEFHRILKKQGKLFLTAPQGWGVHGMPYHFFNFTNYGLESLFKKAGFHINFIKPNGGIFWLIGNRIKTVPRYILSQYLFERNKKNYLIKFKPTLFGFLLIPFYLISIPFCNFLIPLFLFCLDKLDKNQHYTLGYLCYCIKKD